MFFFQCKDVTIRSRAAAVAFHNSSSKLYVSIDTDVSIAVSVVGYIQNFSREEIYRCEIKEYGAVMFLTGMLIS